MKVVTADGEYGYKTNTVLNLHSALCSLWKGVGIKVGYLFETCS